MSSPIVIGVHSAEVDGPQLSPRRTSLIGAPSDPPLSPVSPSPSTPRKSFESGWLAALRAAWHLYSLGDWLVALVAYLVLGGIQLVSARHRFVPNLTDGAINYPVMSSTVPMALLMVLAIVLPVLVMIAVFFFRRKHKFAKAELSSVLSGLMLSTGVTALATDIIKKAVGRPRPNFIAYCGYTATGCNPALSLSTVNDAYASFPSGHASFSFSGLTFLSLYLLTLLPTLRRVRRYPLFSSLLGSSPIAQPAPSRPSLALPQAALPPRARSPRLFLASAVGSREAWLWLLCVSPVFLAGWIAMTRIIDYWHWFDDVLAGSLLGFCVAHFVGAFKFPPPQVALFLADHTGHLGDENAIDLYVGSPSTESEPDRMERCASDTPLPVSVVVARVESR